VEVNNLQLQLGMRKVHFGPYCLVIRPHPHNKDEDLLSLLWKGQEQAAEPLTLKLLRFLADEHPGEEVGVEQLINAIWPDDTEGNHRLVHKHIEKLRRVLGDDDSNKRKYLETLPRGRSAYRFFHAVSGEGEIERLRGFLKWCPDELTHRLAKLKRNGYKSEDVRIVTNGLFPGRHDMDYEGYLRAGLRFRIVMMNPENMTLLKGRYDLRGKDYTSEKAQPDLRQQIEYLERIMPEFPEDALQICLSNAISAGYIVHTAEWALLGIFPAHGSPVLGPMIEVDPNTSLWHTLHKDWKIRWDNPARLIKVQNPNQA
jgi:DNA-binding winged helix-turn-helix (wHTH) protein